MIVIDVFIIIITSTTTTIIVSLPNLPNPNLTLLSTGWFQEQIQM